MLQWKRHLEFIMEGSRVFNLVRCKIIGNYFNSYNTIESQSIPSYFSSDHFVQGCDEFLSILFPQIEFRHGTYIQNPILMQDIGIKNISFIKVGSINYVYLI